MSTNVKIPYESFTMSDRNFFFFNHSSNILVAKNSKGDITFTYPTLEVIGNEVISTAYDGVNFWTLQFDGMNFVIKAWQIDNFFCIQKHKITINSFDRPYDYNITSMSVEYFATTLVSGVCSGESNIFIDCCVDFDECSFYKMSIGPNLDGIYESTTVTGICSDGSFGMNCELINNFDIGTNVSLVNCLWLFNSYVETPNSGELIRYDVVENNMDYSYYGNEMYNINASTFYREGSKKYITFIKGSTLRFFDVDYKIIDKSLFIDNISSNGTVIYPVKDLEITHGTVYRLQSEVNYYGVDHYYSTNNYQCSPIRSFIDSITLNIYPNIIPSDGMSSSKLKAVVKDQYSEPSKFKTVYFTDSDDEYGYITAFQVMTMDDGTCLSHYRSGVSPKIVTITAIVTQFD